MEDKNTWSLTLDNGLCAVKSIYDTCSLFIILRVNNIYVDRIAYHLDQLKHCLEKSLKLKVLKKIGDNRVYIRELYFYGRKLKVSVRLSEPTSTRLTSPRGNNFPVEKVIWSYIVCVAI